MITFYKLCSRKKRVIRVFKALQFIVVILCIHAQFFFFQLSFIELYKVRTSYATKADDGHYKSQGGWLLQSNVVFKSFGFFLTDRLLVLSFNSTLCARAYTRQHTHMHALTRAHAL